MPALFIGLVLLLLAISGAFFIFIYRRHMLGLNAPERKIRVRILQKQAVDVPVEVPGDDDSEFWLLVQPVKGGPEREFKVGVHYYHALNADDIGTLTYQGRQFIHFALERP
ncbi:hypothetical protein VST7929_00124 [Vibrio stylophorae]|uniref:DUF2500 domain-containing protein n=1 Tax=Vibrio stylophorae TaxID=659351 RepID=A0ABM8ZPV0_9VIBR|nr:DUF2500 domain-containing protein [Vibrio stylophorae]CAH0532308.1 hypothetical protein VST7929_00124 [Vibrio stylophorae]